MTSELLSKLREYANSSQNQFFIGKPVSAEQISDAEKELGVLFDEDYTQFLMLYGGSYVKFPVYGFNNCDMLSEETVIDLTLDFRTSYIEEESFKDIQFSYVISMSANGDPIAVQGDKRVIQYCHDSGEKVVLADDFQSLLLHYLNME